MSREWTLRSPDAGDGYFTRDELEEHIEELERQADRAIERGDSSTFLSFRLQTARLAAEDMDAIGADALDYLPEQLRELPANLRRRATELLMTDDARKLGEINVDVLSRARRRYEELKDSSSMVGLRSHDQAMKDLRDIANALDIRWQP